MYVPTPPRQSRNVYPTEYFSVNEERGTVFSEPIRPKRRNEGLYPEFLQNYSMQGQGQSQRQLSGNLDDDTIEGFYSEKDHGDRDRDRDRDHEEDVKNQTRKNKSKKEIGLVSSAVTTSQTFDKNKFGLYVSFGTAVLIALETIFTIGRLSY